MATVSNESFCVLSTFERGVIWPLVAKTRLVLIRKMWVQIKTPKMPPIMKMDVSKNATNIPFSSWKIRLDLFRCHGVLTGLTTWYNSMSFTREKWAFISQWNAQMLFFYRVEISCDKQHLIGCVEVEVRVLNVCVNITCMPSPTTPTSVAKNAYLCWSECGSISRYLQLSCTFGIYIEPLWHTWCVVLVFRHIYFKIMRIQP